MSHSSFDVRGGPPVPPEEAALGCKNITKTFGAVTAVDDVSISIQKGEWVSIVGPNGAGKTSLLNVINGFYEPDPGGQVFLDGQDVTDMRSYQRARHGLGRTFQGLELFESEDVIENVITVKSISRRPNLLEAMLFYWRGRDIEEKNMREVEEIIDYLELWEYRHSPISSLPLGIRRRVDLARALALDPDVILLDEAMSGLTFEEKYDMVRFLTDLYEERGLTVVMIEHDLEVVTDVSDRMIVLQEGAVIARGPPEAVTADSLVAEVYTGVD
ncbi:ABC transporter ATP-binding protein [Haladaptatus sp. DJG-WS-42]|uniref:ABC transporter ATP-binding protein n=1 Tax=Haladaptatus sp. DJG-WS-42 TaxID=3120516 RepID=UPI0030CD165C